MINDLGCYAIPTIILIILFTGIVKGIPVFDIFMKGAKEGLTSSFIIAPSLIGLITAIEMVKVSGALDIFTNLISPITNYLKIPSEIVPLALLRPISGSGSLAILDNILNVYGPDSNIGKMASLIMGSTETTFYTIAVYFGYVGIKNTKHTIPCSLIADTVAIGLAIFIVNNF